MLEQLVVQYYLRTNKGIRATVSISAYTKFKPPSSSPSISNLVKTHSFGTSGEKIFNCFKFIIIINQ